MVEVNGPAQLPDAKHRRGAGEKNDRLKKHISGMDFAEWMLTAFALIEEIKRISSIPTSLYIHDPLSVRLAFLRCTRNFLTKGKLAVGVQKDSTGGDGMSAQSIIEGFQLKHQNQVYLT